MDEPMRIVIDARELSGDSARTGIGTYIRHLLAELAARDDVAVEALATRGTALPEGVRSVPIRRFQTRGRRAVVEHAAMLPVDLAVRSRADVFHNPLFHAPAGIRRPWVQTLHDVIPLVVDDPDSEVLRRRWRRFGPRYRKADAVVAVSQHAAEEGTRVLGLDPTKVHVAHHGVSPAFSPAATSCRPTSTEPPYLLVVSQFSHRKGFDAAFETIGALAEAGYPHHLRVAGYVPPSAQADLDALLARAPRPDRVDVLGYVDDLPELYRGAAAVLVPSRYEGFGLPALEGMASGVPVVSFANTSLVEVVAAGGLLVPDGDVQAMTEAVRSVLDDADFHAEVAARGLRRAADFTWSNCAAATVEVYAAATAARRRRSDP